MEHIANHIDLIGSLASAPQFSHDNHGRRFFSFFLEVERLSGTIDRLPVLASEQLLRAATVQEGDSLHITGQIRSFNSRTPGRHRLIISVLAEQMSVCSEPHDNLTALTGVICKEPVYRRTPLGREICDVMLAVPRAFQRADYLPCILWGRTAQEASQCHTRDKIGITGRLQSRVYTKLTEEGAEERTAYEISALTAQIPMDLL